MAGAMSTRSNGSLVAWEPGLTTTRSMSLDEAIEYLAEDELPKVTPLAYRIRKRLLNSDARGKQTKRAKEAFLEGCVSLRPPRNRPPHARVS